MTADKTTWQPLWLRCKCGHEWDDWQHNNVPFATWIAYIKVVRCPQCGKKLRLFMRTTPLQD